MYGLFIFCTLYRGKTFFRKVEFKKAKSIYEISSFRDRTDLLCDNGRWTNEDSDSSEPFLASRDVNQNDIFVNIGFAGAKEKTKKRGELYFIHKIHAHDSGRDFYPEVLYKQRCPESALESFSKGISDKAEKIQEDLIDMEGAAFFETLSFFVKKRQIFLYKCVSDFLEGEKLRTEMLLEQHLDMFAAIFASFFEPKEKEKGEEAREKRCLQLAEHLFCSATMKVQLQELFHYASHKGMDLESLTEEYWKKEIVSKSEGKKYVEELRRSILEL